MTTLPPILYHGSMSPIVGDIRRPPHGVFFTPSRSWAREHYGKHVAKFRVHADKVYLIDYDEKIDLPIIDALFDRDYEALVKLIAMLREQGYQAMQTVSDSRMVVAFEEARIERLP